MSETAKDEKEKLKEIVKAKIKDNYKNMERVICGELEMASKHPGITGHCREEYWIGFFRKIIPQKFTLETGVMIIDSEGNISNEVDIVVFDNQYTPYLFNYGSLKFIPIEAVSIVIECKSTSWTPEGLKNWSKSIDELEAMPIGISRMVNGYIIGLTNGSQQRTSPIKILASIRKNAEDKTIENINEYFDILIYEREESDNISLKVDIPNKDKSLGWWGARLNNNTSSDEDEGLVLDKATKDEYEKLNEERYNNYIEVDYKDEKNEVILKNTLESLNIENNPLLSLNFQLNQLLMLINNPMLFPHFAYANFFK
ncbi:DUF6602 domain-containing protein [Inediibacterium massiliense]|uniref:DUF6602 domain-containing protein n=1 Tax=Inediibacterium massiliense TaxID=1658111 RepID=UPI0006B6528F|nr:DUF6602 domain-containing protein [Inediibacterium massiliense]